MIDMEKPNENIEIKNDDENNISSRKKVFKMVSVGVVDDTINKLYDIISTAFLILNIMITIFNTFETARMKYGEIFDIAEDITVGFFAVDYFLRIYTADYLYPKVSKIKAAAKYMFSFSGIIDFFSFVPSYLPFFFPSGVSVFRIFRVIRIFRLFRINTYYDSLNVITELLLRKRKQLMSSVFLILVLMLAASLCMYSLEHDAQPHVFKNAFSGIWWATSTLLTVGYGDIYPITPAGKAVGIVIAFLGVGVVAIPTGIISAAFVEQYARLQKIGNKVEEDVHFIKIQLEKNDSWIGKRIMELSLPHGIIIAVIQRKNETIIPRGNVKLLEGDKIILGADSLKDDKPVYLKEIVVRGSHRWNGQQIKDLDISRQTFIVMVKRDGKTLIPKGDLTFREGDRVILYSKIKEKIIKDEYDDEEENQENN